MDAPGAKSGRRILIVDDEPDVRDAFAEMLAWSGHRVTTAANGAQALGRLRRGELPDLIVLDLAMPVMDGPTFRQAALAEPAFAAIPTVVVSGEANVAERAAALGAAGWLRKPLGGDELRELVERVLDDERDQPRSSSAR
jgi:CheY-like chemotaxis protein